MMPKLNGLAVVRQLRAQGFAGPIMPLTARGEKDDRVEGFDAGADDHLPKPFTSCSAASGRCYAAPAAIHQQS